MSAEITRKDIEDAADRISPYVRRTPMLWVGDVFGRGFDLSVKLEHTQVTGSFKPRGAFSLLTAVEVPRVGVAAASGGNFGIAAAHASATLGHHATIFVPATSPAEKIDRIRDLGADVRVIDGYYDQALAECERFVSESGALSAHAYDDPYVMAGQGTIGREIDQDLDADVVLVAVGGGGLIGGVASWFRGETEVVAVEPETCNSFHASRAEGRQVTVSVGGVASSSLGAASVGDYPWSANRWIADSVLVSDAQIIEAQRWIWDMARLVIEPAAATTMAALMFEASTPEPGSSVVAVLSGGNVDPSTVV